MTTTHTTRPRSSTVSAPFVASLLAYGLVAAAAAGSAWAAGEQVGRVRGLVTDLNSQPLPGVTIVASGPALIGEPRTVLSDDRGRYEIVNLPAGIYTLELSYPGTDPNRRQAEVRQGEAVTVNVTYQLTSTGVSTVDLVEARSLTRPDSTHTGSSRNLASINRLPVARQYQSVALMVPGTSGGANPNIKGGSSANNKYLIDGMDVTDPVSRTFAMNLTFDSMDSMEVITGGFDAEYNALGGVINVVPRGGGDEFHATVSAIVNHNSLSLLSNQGTNLWEGEQPFNDTKPGPEQAFEVSGNVGGALIKRKLWYGFTYQLAYTEASLAKGEPLGVPPYNIQHPVRRFIGHLIRARLDFAPVAKHRFRLSANTDPAVIDNTSQSNFLLGVAETQQRQGGLFVQGRWDWLPTPNITGTVLGGYVSSGLEIGPQGRLGKVDFAGCKNFSDANCVYDPNRAQRINTIDSTTWYQGGNYRTDDRYRLQLDPSVSIRGVLFGRHNFKAGLQLQYLWRKRHQETPGGSVYQDSSPTSARLEEGLCDPATNVGCYRRIDLDSYDIRQTAYAGALFLQDHWWTPLTWLTVVPGIRFDYSDTYRHHLRRQRVARLFGIGPRLGVTADVTRDGRNIAFAYYGRATDPVPLNVAAAVDETEAGATRTYEINRMTGEWPTNPLQSTGGTGGVEIGKGLKMPRTDELTAGFRREFFPGTMTGIEYTWKRIAHEWQSVEVNRIWDPTGSRVVGYVDEGKFGRAVFRYSTPTTPSYYQGVILQSEGRPSQRWEYHASHTVSWATYINTLSSIERQARFDRGWTGADLRHYTRLQGAYYLLKNLNVGAVFQYRSQSGGTLTKAFYNRQLNNRSNWRSPSGTTPTSPNDPTGIADFRPPPLVQMDLTVRYNVFPTNWGHSLTAFVDVFNTFNSRTPNDIVSSDLPTFGQVGSRQRPLRLQLGLSYGY